MSSPVVLRTGRLVLRPLEARDLDDFVAMHAHPDVAAFMPRPHDRAEAERRLSESDREWRERGHGLLAVTSRDTGRFLGRTGLRHWPEFEETEVGWVLRREEWGRGYATEAAACCIAWGFSTFPLPCLTAMIHPGNAPSLAVARRLGFVPIREDDLRGERVIVHARGR